MKKPALITAIAIALCAASCAPATFVRTTEPLWAGVDLRADAPYDKAWASVADTLAGRFDLEVVSKEDGYLRTGWLYTWTGQVNEKYRVRIIVKFSQDRSRCEILSEAEYGGPGNWIAGYDSRLIETVKADVTTAAGRTIK